jgi:NitT/TauT family transport system substrate-binding protein
MSMSMHRLTWAMLCGLAAIGLVGAGASAEAADRPAQPVQLLLNWFPEVEHGGFYAALVHGYYKEAGLEVKIVSGGPDISVLPQVASQKVTFGISNADNILFGRAQEVPVVCVMAPLQVSPRCIVVHKKSGIKSFSDLKNMTLAMSNGAAFSHYLRKKYPLNGVKIVPYPGNVAQFLLNENYGQQGYIFSEPFVAESKGGDPLCLMLSDIGFNPYTSCLVVSEKFAKANPATVQKMVQASARGWAKYLEAPEETNRAINKVNPEMGLDVLAYGAKTIRPLVLDPVAKKDGIGRMSAKRWSDLLQQLVEIGQLNAGDVEPDAAFTNAYFGPAKK